MDYRDNKTPSFMDSYVDNFNFESSLSLDCFEKFGASDEMKRISSNSWLRKVYDASLHTVLNQNNNPHIEIDVWFAKIGYQESRKLFPTGFLRFLEGIWSKIKKSDQEKKYENYKKFLEVFLSYHKYFTDK